jgi:transcriptional regulator with XRE-family HTH domain
MPDLPSPTVRLRRLGLHLRRLREQAGLTLDEASARMERSLSSLSKIENGRVRIPPRDLRVILDAYGLEGRTREALLTLARDARKRGWWQQYGDALGPAYLDYISLEADAVAARTFETILVPGLLQTEDYARQIIGAVPPVPGTSHDVDQFVTVRMARQQVLDRSEPLHLWAIIGEAALRHVIGDRQIMCAQLQRLKDVAVLDHITIQVLPFTAGTHAGVDGPFTILEFPEFGDLDVVHVGNLTGALYMENEDEVRRYNLVYDYLRASALPSAESLTLIDQAIEGM